MKKLIALTLVTLLIPAFAYAIDARSSDERVGAIRELVETRKGAGPSSVEGSAKAVEPSGPSATRMVGGLALCLMVLFGGVTIYGKLRKTPPSLKSGRRLKLVERIQIAGKTSLVLAEVDGREVLIAVGAERVAFHGMELSPWSTEQTDMLCQTPDPSSSLAS